MVGYRYAFVAIGQFHLEHGVGKGFHDLPFHFDNVALGQLQPSLHSGWSISSPFARRNFRSSLSSS